MCHLDSHQLGPECYGSVQFANLTRYRFEKCMNSVGFSHSRLINRCICYLIGHAVTFITCIILNSQNVRTSKLTECLTFANELK